MQKISIFVAYNLLYKVSVMIPIRPVTAATAEIWLVGVDPDAVADSRRLLRQTIGNVGIFGRWEELSPLLPEKSCHVIFIEYERFFQAGHDEGVMRLHLLRQLNPGVVVIMAFGYGNFSRILPLVGKEVDAWILKPWDDNKLLATLQTAVLLAAERNERMYLKAFTEISLSPANPGPVFHKSEAMQQLLASLRECGNPCLLYGEPGVGKNWLALWFHHTDGRKGYYSIDFSELKHPEEITGNAWLNFLLQKGYVATLVLDNLHTLPTEFIHEVNSWVKALLTQKPSLKVTGLWSTCSGKNPSDDLVVFGDRKIQIPSLRERKEDIPALAAWIIEEESKKHSLQSKTLPGPVAQSLMRLPWVGNAKELRQVLRNALAHSKSETLKITDFALLVSSRRSPVRKDKYLLIKENERQMVVRALEKHLGNISHAARELGITRQALYRRMEKYGIEHWGSH